MKLMFAVRAKPGLTREEALEHLAQRHAPLVKGSVTLRKRLKTYIQNHAISAPSVPKLTLARDWIVESWRDPSVVLPEPPEAPDAIEVREDEGRFPDRATLLALNTEEAPVWHADPNAPFASAPYKIFTYFKRNPEIAPEAFDRAWSEAADALSAISPFREKATSFIRNRPVPGEGGPKTASGGPSAPVVPQYDAVDIWRFPTREALEALVSEGGFRSAMDGYEKRLAEPGSLFRFASVESIVFDDALIDPASRT